MDYWTMVTELNSLYIDTYNFKDFVIFRHRKNENEIKVSRDVLPRKRATSEQCQEVFKLVKEQLAV